MHIYGLIYCVYPTSVSRSSNFYDNHVLLGGSGIVSSSRTRGDIANLPMVIENW